MKNIKKYYLSFLLLTCALLTTSMTYGQMIELKGPQKTLSPTFTDEPPIAPGPFKPTYESLKAYKCPTWYQDAKFGIWAHWGPQGVAMHGDWYARSMYEEGGTNYKYHLATYGHPSKFGYKDYLQLWKTENFTRQWTILLQQKSR